LNYEIVERKLNKSNIGIISLFCFVNELFTIQVQRKLANWRSIWECWN